MLNCLKSEDDDDQLYLWQGILGESLHSVLLDPALSVRFRLGFSFQSYFLRYFSMPPQKSSLFVLFLIFLKKILVVKTAVTWCSFPPQA